MPKDFYAELVRLLRAAGWRRVPSVKGSHEKWRHDETGRTLIVPRTKSRHTAKRNSEGRRTPQSILIVSATMPSVALPRSTWRGLASEIGNPICSDYNLAGYAFG
ncbi:MAG: type II toxin-antitoxin system HicA family toxin [Rhodoplanes sp.]|jgi:predicted RNA binding protein YcfA (HicA-like mRNA interferase family)